MSDDTMTRQRWVAFGPAGAVGTIRHTDEGYAVRMMHDSEDRGMFPELEVAKRAVQAAMPAGSSRPEFREH